MYTVDETRRIQNQLKSLLKKHGVSYNRLAGELGVSLPTIKRMFSAPDITYRRLSQICGSLGIEVHEILEIMRSPDSDLHILAGDHELFFADHPHYLHYLMALYNTNKTPADLEKLCALSKRSTHLYLKQLTDMKLIRVLPTGKIRFLFTGLIGWREEGPLGRAVSHKTILALAASAMKRTSPYLYLEVSGRRLSANQYEEMKNDFREVVGKYRRISKMNSASRNPSEVSPFDMVLVADRAHESFTAICDLP